MSDFQRCCMALNADHKKVSLLNLKPPLNGVDDFVAIMSSHAHKKFKLSKKQNLIFYVQGQYLNTMTLDSIRKLKNDCLVIVLREGEDVVENKKIRDLTLQEAATITIVGQQLIDEDAITQLNKVAHLEGMVSCTGMPDLHVGQKYPIGTACVSTKLHPELVGSDIGCGVSLYDTDIQVELFLKKNNNRNWIKMKKRLEQQKWVSPSLYPAFSDEQTDRRHRSTFGTIGSGNHFAELQKVVATFDTSIIDKQKIYLLVHSGSRKLGPEILEEWMMSRNDDLYLQQHDVAVGWARANRDEIALRFSSQCETNLGRKILDVCHNLVEQMEAEEQSIKYLHRKGVAPTDQGLVVIPGSRGTMSYLVRPTDDEELAKTYANSIAHGAGRSISRSAAAKVFKHLEKDSDAGSNLVFLHPDTNLLSEEAPGAYKNIDDVIQVLVDYKLIQIIAILEPVLTVKS